MKLEESIGLDTVSPPSVKKVTKRKTKWKESLVTKRQSKEWVKYGRIAEWMAVKEGRTLEEIRQSPEVSVTLQTLNIWSIQHKWQDKRRAYIRRPTTITTLVHDLLLNNLMKAHNHQVDGTTLTLEEITGLEKLLKMYKITGVPFHDQASLVMKEFIKFVALLFKGKEELSVVLDVVEEFSRRIENGLIYPEA
ncbi:MAG: hypothetical protein GY861_22605 [bacterium]|nr:hypothetical protein [bacterium]